MKKIILASTSPRRRDILKQIGIDFEIVAPNFKEELCNMPFSYEKIEQTAKKKALSILDNVDKKSLIISADTVVVYNNIILGKPKDYDDAQRMLKMLSGVQHKVVTAVCILDCEAEKEIIKSETSNVTFNVLTNETIKDYILKFKPYDKAGAYGIQELNEDFIREIIGDYDNIVGLPSKLVKTLLKDAGYSIWL